MALAAPFSAPMQLGENVGPAITHVASAARSSAPADPAGNPRNVEGHVPDRGINHQFRRIVQFFGAAGNQGETLFRNRWASIRA